MKAADTSGINVTNLDSLVLDINDYAERIKSILIDFDDLVQENMQYFQCECRNDFLKVHRENKNNFSIFEKNILSYANDLISVKVKYSNTILEAIEIFENHKH